MPPIAATTLNTRLSSDVRNTHGGIADNPFVAGKVMPASLDWKTCSKAFAIIPKVSGSLSMIGCGLVLRDIGKKWPTIPLTTEIMAHVTVAALFIAFWDSFLSTWMVPKDSWAFLAAGNTATCETQGFISVVMFIILEISYTILSGLYWIIVQYGWTEQKTQRRIIRILFLWLPVILAIGFALPLIFFDMYNFTGLYSCFIQEHPLNCDIDPDGVCTRGANARDFQAGLFIFVLVCTVVILVFMTLLVRCVMAQERASDRYLTKGQEKRREMTRKTFWQAVRYFLVFFVSNIPFYIYAVYDIVKSYPPIPVAFIFVIVWPMFGVSNSFVYFRARYLSFKEKNPDKSLTQCVLTVLDIDLGSWFRKSDESVVPPSISDLVGAENLESPLFQEEST